MDWLYVWSPRYRFFHEFVQSCVKDISGFHVKPIFAEQSLFTPLVEESKHFLTGIPIKIYVIVNYIKKNLGKVFFFTDVDLIILPEFSYETLVPYLKNDITCMYEEYTDVPYNIGCLLIQCNDKTLAFFERVLQRIRNEKLLDQDAFQQELSSFQGIFDTFSKNEFVQSNMINDVTSDYKIIQCLCSEKNPTDVLIEKIITISSAYDISLLMQFLPDDVKERLEA
jgi:hypothetical protein